MMWGSNPFTLQREAAQGCEFHPNCGSLCWKWSFWQDCVSASPTCFCEHFPPRSQTYESLSEFLVFFRKNCSVGSCRFGFVHGRGCVQDPRVAILNQNCRYFISKRGYGM